MTLGKEFLVGDLFCGAGGSSQGCAKAIRAIGGKLVLVCVNHDKIAIATHRKNHPGARHFIEDLNGADPERLVPERRLDLLMASPECRFHSRARGGKPINDQMRMSAYAIQRWLTALNVRCLLVENVPEFIEWGPLCTLEKDHAGAHLHDPLSEPREACDLPDPTKKRLYFEAWLRNIWELGYEFQWRILNAADYGDATTRERFFLQARKDGRPIRWPEPSHAKPNSSGAMFGKLQPWRAAREVIDLDDTGSSIFHRVKPLSQKTLHRIARGLVKFSGEDGKPCLSRMQTELGFDAEPYLAQAVGPGRGGVFILGQHGGSVARSVEHPLPTITGDGYLTKVHPFLGSYYSNGDGTNGIDEPVTTITTKARHALVVPYGPRAEARSVLEPLPTVMTKDRLALCTPFIVPNFGERDGQQPRVHGVDEPLPAVTSHGAGAVVSPADTGDVHYRMLKNRELARAMGFDDAESSYEFTGTQSQITKQIGNAVPVNLAAALVGAILGTAVEETEAVA